MRSFAIATLISAVAANTYTAYSTKIESVISCAADVTDCPGSSTVYHATPTETSTTCTTTDEAHPTVPATWTHPAVTTSAPVYTTTRRSPPIGLCFRPWQGLLRLRLRQAHRHWRPFLL
ncbi:uncharacterized protein K489DRAFT_21746 [Dissoconium aciculare CBS 342.82]|uniref:Uncharacterized protein n=1 Tax=Dissoconium aciculare CBS 342.82 TaxID=1314786 RepID=A0A6J3MI36_9PEZI|nr:uncharacterized protein K489DRAFT_21746 [Dissoconium aciculare CBS 342.82]KAF1827596.1 hypothetical protein K489DRAFT_21746 [Dissoconium aciculare CBS 342.82]